MLNSFEGDNYSSQEKPHGRQETRCALVNTDLAQEGEMSFRYNISSKELTAKELHDSTRAQWLVESMHWQLDSAFNEDACRIRVDDRAEVFSRVRQVV